MAGERRRAVGDVIELRADVTVGGFVHEHVVTAETITRHHRCVVINYRSFMHRKPAVRNIS